MSDLLTLKNSILPKDNSIASKFSTNKEYLAHVYGNFPKEQIDDILDTQIDKKKKKIASDLLMISGGIAFCIVAYTTLKNSKIFNKSIQFISNSGSFLSPMLKSVNGLCLNFTNLKDDLWDRFSTFCEKKKPLKFISKLTSKANELYKNIFCDVSIKKIHDAQKAILKTQDGHLVEKQLVKYDYEKLDDIFKKLRQNLTTNDRLSSLKNLISGPNGKIKNFIKNITSPLANQRLDGLMEESFEKIELPPDSSKELKKAVKKYTNLQKEILCPKLRDIVCGSGPTDFITVGIPAVTFGVSLAATKSKEKRKSILLNLGIPLAPTIFLPIIGLKIPFFSGAKALALSLAVGQVVSRGIKYIDKTIQQKKKEISMPKNVVKNGK